MSYNRELIIIMSTPPTVKVCVDEEGGINPQAFFRVGDFVEVDFVPPCGFGRGVLPLFDKFDFPDAFIFGDFFFIPVDYFDIRIVSIADKIPFVSLANCFVDRLFQVIVVVDDTSVYCFHFR
jgi:hypothetical protein